MAAAAVAQPPAALNTNPPAMENKAAEKPKKTAAKRAAKKPAAPAEPDVNEKTPETADNPPATEAPPKAAAKKPVTKSKSTEPADNTSSEAAPEPANAAAAEPVVTKAEKPAKKSAEKPKPKTETGASKPAVRNNAEAKVRMDQLVSLWSNFQLAEAGYNQQIADIETRLQSAERNIGRLSKFCGEYQLLWKVKGFRGVYEDAVNEERTTIKSPMFDTHRNGYKIQLSLCPNGDGKGKGQAMSVFFAIVKGPYDNILPWPFTCPVKITLVDQQALSSTPSDEDELAPNDIVRVFTPNPLPENEAFLGRPVDRNMSLGFSKFIALPDLLSGHYIQEDALYLKVFVDISGVFGQSNGQA